MIKTSKHWAKHPYISYLFCHKDGKRFKYKDKEYKAIRTSQLKKDERYIISWKLFMNGTSYSPYKLTLESWWGIEPQDGKRYYARVKNGNPDNINYKNLFWTTSLFKKFSENNSGQALSKLTLKQVKEIYNVRNKENKPTLKELSGKYGVSDMSIHRAIKRYERTFILK